MKVIVIDMSPEIYWYASGALAPLNLEMIHFPDSAHADKIVYAELPDIVILNSDDKSIKVETFIAKMRNHVFARNCMFVVFTSNLDKEYKKTLVVNGAAQVFQKTPNNPPDQKYFLNSIKWLLDLKKDNANPFDAKFTPCSLNSTYTSWGRMGFITKHKCLIESNMDLNPGDSISISSSLFDELGLKDTRFICTEKNTVGRYYQYANSFIGRIESKQKELDSKKLEAWIKDNKSISKIKPIKILYFESHAKYREEITAMIKLDKRYCARGYDQLDQFEKILNYQLPNLILINRNLIQKDKQKFEPIKKFLKTHFCFCITYAHDDTIDLNEFKNNFNIDHIMHIQNPVDEKLLESMVSKIEEKMPKDADPDDKVVFNKHSAYSRLSFTSEILVTGLSEEGIQIQMPFKTSSFCSAEIESSIFSKAKINPFQILRTVEVKAQASKDGVSQKLIFVGISHSEKTLIQHFIEEQEKEGKKA